MRKFAIAAASAMLGLAMAFPVAMPNAYAASKVDCNAVMQEVSAGKTVKDIAADQKISVSSVYRCKRHAKEAAKAANKNVGKGRGAKAMAASSAAASAMASPAAAASPAK